MNPAAPAYLLGTVNDDIVAHIQCADRSRLGVGHGVDTGLRYHGDGPVCAQRIGLTRRRLGVCNSGVMEHGEDVVGQSGNEDCQQHQNHNAPDDDANDCIAFHLIYPPSGQEWL